MPSKADGPPSSRKEKVRMARVQRVLHEVARHAFPTLASHSSCRSYVDETFGSYGANSGRFACELVEAMEGRKAPVVVLGRCLFRDLVLRFTYLELCERNLREITMTEDEAAMVRGGEPLIVLKRLVARACERLNLTREELGPKLGGDRHVRRALKGETVLSRESLGTLSEGVSAGMRRTIFGVGFVAVLVKELEADLGPLKGGFGESIAVLFSELPARLRDGQFRIYSQLEGGLVTTVGLDGFVRHGGSLLLHPGLEELIPSMPSPLWRAHLYALRFGRLMELCEFYLKHSEPDSDKALENWFEEHERDKGGAAWQW
jgi:hypothetical protein